MPHKNILTNLIESDYGLVRTEIIERIRLRERAVLSFILVANTLLFIAVRFGSEGNSLNAILALVISSISLAFTFNYVAHKQTLKKLHEYCTYQFNELNKCLAETAESLNLNLSEWESSSHRKSLAEEVRGMQAVMVYTIFTTPPLLSIFLIFTKGNEFHLPGTLSIFGATLSALITLYSIVVLSGRHGN